jgi:ATPase complex subunit ATP10
VNDRLSISAMNSATTRSWQTLLTASTLCRNCQRRLIHTTRPLLQGQQQQQKIPRVISTLGLPAVDISSKRTIAPRFLGKDFVAQPLGAPVGVKRPPLPQDDPIAEEEAMLRLQQGGIKGRLDRNTVIRQDLLKGLDRSHVRDYKNITKAPMGGKFYLGNKALYKSELSLYWPNLLGKTLAGEQTSTTELLSGMISVVCLFQRQWAFDQTTTFVGSKENPQLAELLSQNSDVAQKIEINMEHVSAVGIFGWLFQWQLRRQRTEQEQHDYLVLSGFPQSQRESLGIMNNSIGYVFLVDQNCRIRWSGCAQGTDEEKQTLWQGVNTLINRAKLPKKS